MSEMQTRIDATFYNLIFELVDKQQEQGPERRGNQRQPFLSKQRVAPREGAGLPGEAEFFEVACHDLTRNGFSFLANGPPSFRNLVAMFGTPPKTLAVAAEVVRCTDVLIHPSGIVEEVDSLTASASGASSKTMTLVGCRFLQRVEIPTDSPPRAADAP